MRPLLLLVAKLVVARSRGLFRRRDAEVDARRNGEAESFGDGFQIESVDVEDAFEGVGGVGGDVGLVSEKGAFVEKVVLLDEFLQLRLNVGDLVPAEFVLVERHFGLLQIAQETQLLGTKNQESVSRSTFSMSFSNCG